MLSVADAYKAHQESLEVKQKGEGCQVITPDMAVRLNIFALFPVTPEGLNIGNPGFQPGATNHQHHKRRHRKIKIELHSLWRLAPNEDEEMNNNTAA
jgi:hypothetical protein